MNQSFKKLKLFLSRLIWRIVRSKPDESGLVAKEWLLLPYDFEVNWYEQGPSVEATDLSFRKIGNHTLR